MFWAVKVELEHLQFKVKEWERIAFVDSLFFVFIVFFYLYFVILIAVLSFFFHDYFDNILDNL